MIGAYPMDNNGEWDFALGGESEGVYEVCSSTVFLLGCSAVDG